MQYDIYNTNKRKEYLDHKNNYTTNMSLYKQKTEEASNSVLEELRYRKKKIRGGIFNVFIVLIIFFMFYFVKGYIPFLSLLSKKNYIIMAVSVAAIFFVLLMIHVIKRAIVKRTLKKELKYYKKEYHDKAYESLKKASALVIPMLIDVEYGSEIDAQRIKLKERKFKKYCKKINKLYIKKFKKLKILNDYSAQCAYYEEWYYEKTKFNEQERRNEERSNLARMYNKYS